MSIKRKIIELCDDMIVFWNRLKREIEQIPNENKAEIVCRWNSYFSEYSCTTLNLVDTNMDVEMTERDLIEAGALKYDT